MEAPSTQCAIGFLDLPAEIKNRIYRLALTSLKPLRFNERFPRKHLSPQLLRCCKIVYQEVTAILYAENTFVVSKLGDVVALRSIVPETMTASVVKKIAFIYGHGQGQDLVNKTRVTELRWFRGLETIVIEDYLYQRPRRKTTLKEDLRAHDNFEAVKNLAITRPGVRVIYRAYYYGRVSDQLFSHLLAAERVIVYRKRF